MTAYEVDRLLDEQRQPEHDIAVVSEATLDDLNPTLVHALLECERNRHPHVFAERSDMDMMLDLRILRRMPTGHPADDTVKHAAKHAADCDPAGTASREDDTDIGADTDTDEETRIASVPRPTLAGLLAVGRYPQVLSSAQRHHRRLPRYLTRRRVHRRCTARRLRNHHRPDPDHDR